MKRINYYEHLHKLSRERYNTSYIAGLTSEQRSEIIADTYKACLLYTSPSPRDRQKSRMPSSA